MKNLLRDAVRNRLRWRRACETARPDDWCPCVPLLGPAGIDTLMHFAPPGVEIEQPKRSAWDTSLFCPDCGRPRTPCYLYGIWPAGLHERLTGAELEEELELEMEDDAAPTVVFPLPATNGYHLVEEPKPTARRDDGEWGNSDSDDDWAL